MLLFNQAALLKALGWSLFNSLWQMGLFWLVYVVVVFCWKKISAAQKHSLALFCLAAGTVFFGATFFYALANDQVYTQNAGLLSVSGGWMAKAIISAKAYLVQALPFASVVYLVILSWLSIRYFLYYRHTAMIRTRGLQKISPSLRMFVKQVAARLGIKKNVEVWLSAFTDSPVTVGYLKPVILLPVAVINHLSIEQTEAILLHELAHIRRNDYLVNLVVTFAELIFFFNPFARLLIKQTKTERENSCDDSVINFKFDSHLYASALLQVAKQHQRSQQFELAAGGKCRKNLLHRIKRLHGQPVKENYFVTRSLCFLLVIFLGGSIVFMRPQQYVVSTFIRGSQETPVFTVSETMPVPPSDHVIKIKAVPPPSNHRLKTHIQSVTPAEPVVNEDAALVAVSEDATEDADHTPETITTAVTQDNQDFSLQPSAGSWSVPNTNGTTYPFIPSSSYSYQVLKDTTPVERADENSDTDIARESLQKALHAIDAIDWNQLRKTVNSSLKKVDMDKLRGEIRRSLEALDWEKIQGDTEKALAEVNTDVLKSDLKIQLDALQKLRYNNRAQAQKLEKDILRDQLKLRQKINAQQREAQRRFELQLKKSKVIYI